MPETKLLTLLEGLGGERRINYSLERFTAALKSLGNPEKNVHTLVIGGTNGKGTTTLLVSGTLAQAGFEVMTYLSPHLQSPTERFLHNLVPIEVGELSELAEEMQAVAKRFDLSYFEFLTLLAFVRAQRRQVDFLVLEVGLGGRLDATNVTDPIATVVTNIGFDHMDYLGNTLEEILEEKLGILREESLLFTGIQENALLKTVEARCAALDAIYYYAKEIKVLSHEIRWDSQTISLNDYPFELTHPGKGNRENAALAFLLLRIAFPSIPLATIQTAFRKIKNPGRFEIVSEHPRVILSGDHNPAGIEDLLQTLKPLKPERLLTLCGFSPDKPYRAMFERLKSVSNEITLTQATRFQGKMPADYPQVGNFTAHPLEAVETLMKRANPDDTILITGSLYLVGEVRTLWHSGVDFWKAPEKASPPFSLKPDAATRAKARAEGAIQNLSQRV